MGFSDFLFGKTIKTGDAFFGEMVFVEVAGDPSKSYFECARYFKPSAEMINLSVTGSLSGPTPRQQQFFTQLENDYSLLVDKLVPLVEERFSAWMRLPIIQDFKAEFTPVYISLPACDQQPIEWEIAFDTVHDLNHTLTVGLLGYEPQFIRVDG